MKIFNWLKTHLILILLILSFILRIYNINNVPASLFGDEMDVGYHAYSILKTGRDYSGDFMPLHFHSLAEWRTPLYLYSAVPTVAMFGISPLGVRLPAVIFGVLGVYGIYLLFRLMFKNENIGIISAFLLSINPWHLQYSRAGFEVTMLLAFLIFGLYFFFKSINGNGKYLWISLLLLVLTPLIYSTAKLFTLMLLFFLLITYKKEIFTISKKYIFWTIVTGLVFGGVTTYAVLFSGGSQRFNYISVFSDPVTEPEIGVARLNDSRVRGEYGTGIAPKLLDRIMHNKFVYWSEKISNNYIKSFSTDFLFVNGDPNPRHMIDGMGMFYKIDILLLIVGVIYFFSDKNQNYKNKLLVLFWILAGIIPSAITRDGGDHATRLITILPTFVLLMSYGYFNLPKLLKYLYIATLALLFVFYLHSYYVHYPSESERWWHYGWKQAISSIKEIDGDYDKVIITMKDEPAWIFFAAAYEYNPEMWQKEFPVGNDVELNGFGKVSHTGKFYFASPEEGIYSLENVIDRKTLYLASAKEVAWNLLMDPKLKPNGLKLIKSVAFPSGEPAFYIFTKE